MRKKLLLFENLDQSFFHKGGDGHIWFDYYTRDKNLEFSSDGFGLSQSTLEERQDRTINDLKRLIKDYQHSDSDPNARQMLSSFYFDLKYPSDIPLRIELGSSCLGQILYISPSIFGLGWSPIFIPDIIPPGGAYFTTRWSRSDGSSTTILYRFWVSEDGMNMRIHWEIPRTVEYPDDGDVERALGWFSNNRGIYIYPNYITVNNPNGYIPTT